MREDPIVAEIRKLRDAYASKFDYDLAAICRDLRKRHAASGKPMVRRIPVRLSGNAKVNGCHVTEPSDAVEP